MSDRLKDRPLGVRFNETRSTTRRSQQTSRGLRLPPATAVHVVLAVAVRLLLVNACLYSIDAINLRVKRSREAQRSHDRSENCQHCSYGRHCCRVAPRRAVTVDSDAPHATKTDINPIDFRGDTCCRCNHENHCASRRSLIRS